LVAVFANTKIKRKFIWRFSLKETSNAVITLKWLKGLIVLRNYFLLLLSSRFLDAG